MNPMEKFNSLNAKELAALDKACGWSLNAEELAGSPPAASWRP